MLYRIFTPLLGIAIGLGAVGCSTATGTGALAGGAGGAAIGALATRGSVGGTVVGGALGALTGAAIGNSVDRANAQRAYDAQYGAPPPPPPPPGYYGPPPHLVYEYHEGPYGPYYIRRWVY